MPEHIRALIVVLVLSGAIWFFAKPVVIQLIASEDFHRWRNLWFFTILAWFLAHNFWIYVALMVVALSIARQKEKYIFGLFLLLVLAAPPSQMAIPGFGIIDHLFVLTHYRLLALVLLLPAALTLARKSGVQRLGAAPIDWAVLGYLAWLCLMDFRETSITNGFRIMLLNVVDYLLPYYVASRAIKTSADFRGTFSGLVLGGVFVSVFAIFEVVQSWRLYTASAFELGLFRYPVTYKMRGDFLRPASTVIDSIMVGWVIVVAMAALLHLRKQTHQGWRQLTVWIIVVAGVTASMSRAPWLAAIILSFTYILQSEKAITSLLKFGAIIFISLLMLSWFPSGQAFLDLLPFIGKDEQGSVDYRENLISAAIPAIERNFFTGDPRIPDIPELQGMRQGEGIIDLVNSYLAVMLYSGAIGLFFYLAMFFSALRGLQRAKRTIAKEAVEFKVLARTLVAMLVANMFMLMTASSILTAPILIYSTLGFCSAFVLACAREYPRRAF